MEIVGFLTKLDLIDHGEAKKVVILLNLTAHISIKILLRYLIEYNLIYFHVRQGNLFYWMRNSIRTDLKT